MEGDDPDTWLAYYCFVARNWSPSQYDSLSYREKVLIAEFAKRESKTIEKQRQQAKSGRR